MSSKKATTGVRPEGESLKHRLVAAARALLETQGAAALTLRAAARNSGVSHMAPYRHFSDKDELLAAVAEQGFAELAARMESAPGDERQPVEIGVAYVRFALENPGLYRLMFGQNFVPRTRYPGLAAAGDRAFAGCLRASGDNLEGQNERAIVLWSLVHGLANLAMDGLVTLPADEAGSKAAIAALLVRSVRPATV